MSIPQRPKPAKLLIGLFMREKHFLEEAIPELSSQFGEIDLVSAWMTFDFTDYYEPEMGTPLGRRVLVFKELIPQDSLAGIKTRTNKLEQKLSHADKRRINIDPGYLLLERFVLASGKNFSHRIYIGEGIYADLTLVYQKGAWQTLPWTYPDYADPRMLAFLYRVRHKYVWDLKQVKI
ncbi:MAG: DUF4416 family protein [Desulfobacterales bacterium]|nr:MAG: DUF4416 family protein [Desulfobacterales bacterium]